MDALGEVVAGLPITVEVEFADLKVSPVSFDDDESSGVARPTSSVILKLSNVAVSFSQIPRRTLSKPICSSSTSSKAPPEKIRQPRPKSRNLRLRIRRWEPPTISRPPCPG
jgi:hypothetical protein